METTTEETRAEAMTTTSQKTSTTTGISEHDGVLDDPTLLRAIWSTSKGKNENAYPWSGTSIGTRIFAWVILKKDKTPRYIYYIMMESPGWTSEAPD